MYLATLKALLYLNCNAVKREKKDQQRAQKQPLENPLNTWLRP
jgi:hypothetical protein